MSIYNDKYIVVRHSPDEWMVYQRQRRASGTPYVESDDAYYEPFATIREEVEAFRMAKIYNKAYEDEEL